jgi:hypothetical protein
MNDFDKTFPCPTCNGKKKLMAFVDGHRADGTPFGGVQDVDCFTCRGTGEVDEQYRARLAAGKAMRDERVAKDQSLREAARERGISPAELSAIEHGRIVSPTSPEKPA